MTDKTDAQFNNLAVVSLLVAVFAPPAGLLLGVLAHGQIYVSGERGQRLATAGVVVSSVMIGVGLLLAQGVVAVFGVLAFYGGSHALEVMSVTYGL